MKQIIDFISQPWPWYVAGSIIGLTIPLLLILENKRFGISSTFRQLCAACIPNKIPFFQYNWKKEQWNLWFVAGILIGGYIGNHFLRDPEFVKISTSTIQDLKAIGIKNFEGLMPSDIFSWSNLFTWKGFIFFILGGFMVGFGTRYAGGCTSGHSIMGLANLQWPSLVATICFMIGGICMTHFILPFLLKL